jgi:hypothetical protein
MFVAADVSRLSSNVFTPAIVFAALNGNSVRAALLNHSARNHTTARKGERLPFAIMRPPRADTDAHAGGGG